MLRVPDPFGSFAPGTPPGAYNQDMRGRLTDSTRPTFRNATFSARRDLYVTVSRNAYPRPNAVPGYARFRSARSAVEDSGDFSPCRNTHAGGLRSGSDRAADSGMRNRASAWPAGPAVA